MESLHQVIPKEFFLWLMESQKLIPRYSKLLGAILELGNIHLGNIVYTTLQLSNL